MSVFTTLDTKCRSHWPRGLWRRSVAARLLVLRVRIPPMAWMSFCCECCVLSGREVYATDRSLVQRSPTVYDVCLFRNLSRKWARVGSSVALVVQQAMRMRHIMMPSVDCSVLLYFSALSHQRARFLKKKKLLNTKCVF